MGTSLEHSSFRVMLNSCPEQQDHKTVGSYNKDKQDLRMSPEPTSDSKNAN